MGHPVPPPTNICPFFPEKKAFQIRGLAVIEKFRRRGIASALIKETEITLRNKFSIELIWLNSRTIASKLYDLTFEEVFDIFAMRIIVQANPENEKAFCWRV